MWISTHLYPVPSGHGGFGRNGTNTGSLPCRLSYPATWASAVSRPTDRPPDITAILEWGLHDPFIPQDRPPLSIAMLATIDGARAATVQVSGSSESQTPVSFFSGYGLVDFLFLNRQRVPVWLRCRWIQIPFMAMCLP